MEMDMPQITPAPATRPVPGDRLTYYGTEYELFAWVGSQAICYPLTGPTINGILLDERTAATSRDFYRWLGPDTPDPAAYGLCPNE